MNRPDVEAFFDEDTYTVSYVVGDATTGRAAIIDSVLNYDSAAGRTTTRSADEIIGYVRSSNLNVDWLLETHVHADHLSAAQYLQSQLGGQIAIGEQVGEVQSAFQEIFNLDGIASGGGQFNHLFADGEMFRIGDIDARVIATPGHTPACISYVIGNACFVGDTLFMPDYGTARTDFPGGSAADLFDSIQRILSLPDDVRLYMCHDYKAPGRDEFVWEATVAEQRQNVHLPRGRGKAEFVALREARDAELSVPKLILPAIQVNIRAGQLPAPENNGTRYLKIPLDTI